MPVARFSMISSDKNRTAMLTVEPNRFRTAQNSGGVVSYSQISIGIDGNGFGRSTQSHCFSFLVL